MAKRGEPKIRKNQPQARGTGQDCQDINNQSELSDRNSIKSNSAVHGACRQNSCSKWLPFSFAGVRNGQAWWFRSTFLVRFRCRLNLTNTLEQVWMFLQTVPGWRDESKEEACREEEDISRIEGPQKKMCPTYTLSHQKAWMLQGNNSYSRQHVRQIVMTRMQVGTLQKACDQACFQSIWIATA